jgi:heptosyltransferase III
MLLQPPTSILFIAVSRIGDSLFATPAMRAVACAWPEARITVLGHPKRAEVFENLPWIRTVGTISKGRAALLGRLGAKRFDLAFVFGFDEPLVAYALRAARKVVAFEQADKSLNARLFAAVPKPPFQSEHAVRQLLRLPAAVGVAPAGLRIAYGVTADEIAEARLRLSDEGLADARLLVGLQVASFPTKAYRDWPIENFAELCHRVSRRWPQAGFLIYGGAEESSRTSWLKEQLGARAALFAGRLSLRQTASLMTLTDLYVGVDTGPTHIMSALDIPMVGMYHCISPSTLTGPLEHPCAYLIDHPAGREHCGETSAMAEISVDAVFGQVGRALTEHPPRSR